MVCLILHIADQFQSQGCFVWNVLLCVVLNFLWSASFLYHPPHRYQFIRRSSASWLQLIFPGISKLSTLSQSEISSWIYGPETKRVSKKLSHWLKLWKKSREFSEAMISAMRTELTKRGLSGEFDTIDHFCLPGTSLICLQDSKLAWLTFYKLRLPLRSLPCWSFLMSWCLNTCAAFHISPVPFTYSFRATKDMAVQAVFPGAPASWLLLDMAN